MSRYLSGRSQLELDDVLDDDLTVEDSVALLDAARVERPRRCTGCGCTDERGCPGGCRWVTPTTCSRCAEGLGLW